MMNSLLSTNPDVQAPIFVVGVPRSGTGALAWKLSKHPDLARITQVTKKTASSLLLTRLLMLFRDDHEITEGGDIWRKFCKPEHKALDRDDVTENARQYFQQVIQNHLQIFDRERFMSKCPDNMLRVDYFNEIFPDAYFIHIVRDGRAVARSILSSFEKHDGYWGLEFPGWKELRNRPWLEAAALQWKRGIDYLYQTTTDLPDDRFFEVKYETYCENPFEVLNQLSQNCDLTWDTSHLSETVSDIDSRNYKWKDEFDRDQIETVERLQKEMLEQQNYNLEHVK